MTYSRFLVPIAIKSKTRAQCICCQSFICNKNFKKKRQGKKLSVAGKLISAEKIKKLFAHRRVLVNSKHHYICKSCNDKDIMELDIKTKEIDDQKIQTYNESLSYIQADYQKFVQKTNNYIEYEKLSNETCQDYAGITKDQIKQLATEYNLNEEEIFLWYTKCNTNIDNQLLATMFGKSRNTIGDLFTKTTENLYNTIAHSMLGENTWTREKINNHTPQFSKKLLNIEDDHKCIALCCDKFAIDIEKPGDCSLQKLTYSAKDCCNSIGFHLITTLDGSYVCIQGGFGSNGHNNEQTIMNSLTSHNYAKNLSDSNNIYHNCYEQTYIFQNVMKNDDILIADRGYRRIKKRDFKIKIPHSIAKKKTQLTTKQANETRIVTCMCYVNHILNQVYINLFIYIQSSEKRHRKSNRKIEKMEHIKTNIVSPLHT
jgi:DDE superfamily endonuclease